MKRLLVATKNRGKLGEIKVLLSGVADEVVSVADFPDMPDTVEDGTTFLENALKKAREACKVTGINVLADDSGLVVDALDGAPGVYSARFAGDGADDAANNMKLLKLLESVPFERRRASFVCVMAFVSPDGAERTFQGRVGGVILDALRGDGGFGYDPLFLVDGYQQTMAELPMAEKNRISHRGQALSAFRDFLAGRMG